MATGWEAGSGDQPLPPMNGQVVGSYMHGVVDLRWDDPSQLAGNTSFNVIGVNIYRSDASDRGPYRRLNDKPVGTGFWRDRTNLVLVREAIADDQWQARGDAANNRRWTFRTREPIVQLDARTPRDKAVAANSPFDVRVKVDGVQVPVDEVFGRTGEVTLVNLPQWNSATDSLTKAALPGLVEIEYHAARNHVVSGLDRKLSYRLATVVLDPATPAGLRETSLNLCQPLSTIAVEADDYIWHEAVRRNSYILQQGGERVKVFVRRISGVPCDCQMDPRTREWIKQPSNRCVKCYGTGFIGGFEGPYEAIIGPDDGERRVSQGPTGRRLEHSHEVFMGPSPLVTQRDFIVKQTGERYSIGPVRRPTNRGNVLQQHFTIAYLDEGEIRYRVPIDGTSALPWPQTRTAGPIYGDAPARAIDGAILSDAPFPVGPQDTHPMGTDHANWPEDKQPRGRTLTWENENLGILFIGPPLLFWLLHGGLDAVSRVL